MINLKNTGTKDFLCYMTPLLSVMFCTSMSINAIMNSGEARGVRLICGTADQGAAEPVETAEPTEPKEMTVLLQLPLADAMK